MNVAFITDDNYVLPTSVAIISLVKNTHTELNIYVVCDSLDKEKKETITKLGTNECNIEIIEVGDRYDFKKKDTGRFEGLTISKAALLKFSLPDILSNVEKVLFIDGDTIINRDLSELYNEDIENYYLAAVNDIAGLFDSESTKKYYSDIDTPREEYFNTGVMLMNLKQMREDSVSKKLIELRKKYEDPLMDQNTYNIVTWKKKKRIHSKYNFQTRIIECMELKDINQINNTNYNNIDELLNDQYILHTIGREKPWVMEIPYISSIYNQYYVESPFYSGGTNSSFLVNRRNEYEELKEMYVRLYKKTDILRKPRNFIKSIFNTKGK